MRLLFTLLGVLLLAVALGYALQQAPGEVVFSFRGWIIQTSLVVFAIAFIILLLLGYLLLRALEKLLRIPSGLRRWSEHRRDRRMSAAETEAEQLSSYAGLLREAGSAQDSKALQSAWRRTPRKLKKKSALIGAYVNERLRFGGGSDCETVLRQALKREWEPELVRLFGLVEGKNPKQQQEFAEEYLRRRPEDPHLLLALGRLCKKNQLWGKARSYFEQSLQLQPSPAAYQELAILLDEQGDRAAAVKYYQQGLNIATGTHEAGTTRALAQYQG